MTNNPTIDGVSRELLRKQFEEKNEHRGWFVAGGISESDTPEGFVYSDFTTDMCWTCYFEANAALQSTIAQLRQHKNDYMEAAEETRKALTADIAQLQARVQELESGRGRPVAWLHTMHFEEGFGSQSKISALPENAFGKPGVDYDEMFKVTCEPLYTAPPAPVAVVLPELFEKSVRDAWWSGFNNGKNQQFAGHSAGYQNQECESYVIHACLDATAALNEERK